MKKLVSICFLSILFSMFSVQAQRPRPTRVTRMPSLFSVFSVQAQRDCCFQLFNPSADTIRNIANLPNGNLPLNHTMNKVVYQGTDVYELMFSDENCLGIDYETGKVSIETELWLDGENVLDGQHDLSRYCDITLQTSYNELHWLGTPLMPDNGFEYPGAIQWYPGTYEISNVAFDYFFFKFLVNSKSRLVITWNQYMQDAVLIVNIRERINGTNNELYWDEGQRQNLGGHQSHPGRILASDTLTNRDIIEYTSIIKDCDPVTVGKPIYTMDTTGIYKIAYVDTSCGYRIDSVITYDYTHYVHPTTPTLSDSSFSYCQYVTSEPIILPTEPNPALADHADQIVAYWSVYGRDFEYMESFTPITDTTAGTYEFYVKRHDNLWGCESEIDTFHITINQIPDGPVVPEADRVQEYCVNDSAAQLVYNRVLPEGMQVLWGTNPDEVTSTEAPTPTTTAAGTQIYYLRIQDMNTVNQCVSADYDSIIVNVYANPVVTISAEKDTVCFGESTKLSANPTNLTTYTWKLNNVDIAGATATTYTYINDVTDTTTQHFTVYVTEAHPEVTCHATSGESLILAYPEIGAPTLDSGVTTVCGPQYITLKVANGQHASTSTWYAADKTTVLTEGTEYTATYSANTTLYVSSSNDFGCVTEVENWLKIDITVNDIPHITLSADNDGEVCAESELIIRSAVVDTTSAAYIYDWTSIPAATLTPTDADTTTFVAAAADTYKVALSVTDANGCTNTDTIAITVDTLPVITAEVNYNVFDNDYCVNNNGKIIFTTPDYVEYSIDNGANWQESKEFTQLAANTYSLVVENAKGCRNHAKEETITDAPAIRTLTVTDTANTNCEAPYNGVIVAHIAAEKQGRTAETPKTYEYSLSNGSITWGPQSDSVFTALKQGEYQLAVVNTTTGCADTLNIALDSNFAVISLFLSDSANTHCAEPYGGFIYVDSVKPLANYQYKLDQIYTEYQTSNTFAQLQHGHYTVFAKDMDTRCVAEDTINVRFIGILPTGTVSSLDYICFGDTARVSFVPDSADVIFQEWTYVGTATSELIDPIKNLQSFTLKNFPAGKHTFTAHFKDTVTKCDNQATKTIRVIGVNINLHQITSGSNICENDTVIVYSEYFPDDATADSIIDYHWYHPNHFVVSDDNDTIKVVPNNSESGKRVSVVATDNHNCQSTKYIDLIVYDLPNIMLEGEVEYCQNSVTTIVASTNSLDPRTYKWTMGGVVASTKDTLSVLVSRDTAALLTITDGHGCKNDSTIVINTVEVPGAPIITPAVQYFCAASDISVIPTQATPQIGTLRWIDSNDPNVLKVAGNYSAVFDTVHSASLTCTSDTAKVEVKVSGVPTVAVTIKYNDETTPSDSTARCYVETPTDTLHVNVTPVAYATATDTLNYTYTLNGVVTTANMILSHVVAGTYVDTIGVSARRVNPDGNVCTWDTTIYYHFTVNPLPASAEFRGPSLPTIVNGYIHYCEGDTAVYNFVLYEGETETYTYGDSVKVKTKPVTQYADVDWIVTNQYGCTMTYRYHIKEIPIPTYTITNNADNSYCESEIVEDTIIATISNQVTYQGLYKWNGANKPKVVDYPTVSDTCYHQFTSSDTMVTVIVGISTGYGDITGLLPWRVACYAQPDTLKVNFIDIPTKPVLDPTYTYYENDTTVAYCAGEIEAFEAYPVTKEHFSSTSDSIQIIHYVYVSDFPHQGSTLMWHSVDKIDTAGTYCVVAYNKLSPYCPSDTLFLTVREKRTPGIPLEFGASMYNDTVLYCEGSSASYNFSATVNDTLTYAEAGTDVFSDVKPTTAGTYTLRITDKVDGCYIDTNYRIIQVNNPIYNVNVAWNDTDICYLNNHFVRNYVLTISTTDPVKYGATRSDSTYWNGVKTNSESPTYDFYVTNDTILHYNHIIVDTYRDGVLYGPVCSSSYKDTIDVNYFGILAKPVYNGTKSFCDGDSVVISASNFSITYGVDTALYTNPSLPKTYTDGGSMKAVAYYGGFPTCHSDTTTITITKNPLPTVSITPNATTICKGDTATLKAGGASTYVWSTGEITDSIKVTDSIQYVVTGTDVNNCSNTDTAKVNFYPGFEVTMSNDTLVCKGQPVNVTATISPIGSYSYNWFKDGVSKSIGTASGVGTLYYGSDIPAESAIIGGVPVPTLYSIEVKDDHGCKSVADSNVVAVASTDRPQFEFREVGGTESIRSMEAHVGDATSFDMYIHQNCWNPELRVFVDFQIYKDGVPMTDEELATTLDHTIGIANSSYSFDLTHNAPAISTLRMSSSNYNTASNFFPQSEMLDGTAYTFDWFYLHFLSDRKVTVNLGSWKPASAGKYTITYAVIVAGEYSSTNGLLYNTTQKVGGYSSHIGLTAKDTIAFDYMTIYVDDLSASGEGDEDITSITTLDPSASVDMKVYPNPANVSVNVAVAGVQGKTNVQVFDMSGKAVISTQVNVDYDGQIITLPVDNFAQGMYFIKVVNGDAMMTKKLVIKR